MYSDWDVVRHENMENNFIKLVETRYTGESTWKTSPEVYLICCVRKQVTITKAETGLKYKRYKEGNVVTI